MHAFVLWDGTWSRENLGTSIHNFWTSLYAWVVCIHNATSRRIRNNDTTKIQKIHILNVASRVAMGIAAFARGVRDLEEMGFSGGYKPAGKFYRNGSISMDWHTYYPRNNGSFGIVGYVVRLCPSAYVSMIACRNNAWYDRKHMKKITITFWVWCGFLGLARAL